MEERMNENIVKLYYFTSLYRPRIHFTIGSSYLKSDEEALHWDQYIMKKSSCRTDVYEQDFILEYDQYLEFVFCSDNEDDSKVKWENPRQDTKQSYTKGNNFLIDQTGVFAIYQGYIVKVNQQKLSDKQVIFTDIDGTLYGDFHIHEAFKRFFISNGLFCNANLKLVYSTGRNLQSFKDLQKSAHLLFPDILVASCGSDIYQLGTTQNEFETNPYNQNQGWVQYITQDNWDLQALYDFVKKEFPAAQPNLSEGVSQYKGSFLLTERDSRQTDQLDVLIKKAYQQLRQNWKYIISGHGSHRFLDILPERADKGSSLQYVCMKILKTDYTKSAAFGDSLNDVDLLCCAGQGFIVANAQEDLLNWFSQNQAKFQNIKVSPYHEGDAIAKYLQQILKGYGK
ncbi:hypothetical protein ABPG74_022225 [Tetrahymena malaccensis]